MRGATIRRITIGAACILFTGCGGEVGLSREDDNTVLVRVVLSILTVCAIPIGVIALFRWLRYRQRWYYRSADGEVGPLSDYQFGQLYKTGQITPQTPIRQVKDKGWHTGVAVEDPPRRFARGLVCGIVALFVGFPLCFGLFGHVRGGNYLRIDELVGELNPVRVGYLNGLTETQMKQMGLIRTGVLIGEIAPTPWAPAASQAADYIDRSYDLMLKRVERAQNLTLGGTALLVFLSATGSAVTARARVRIINERQVVIKSGTPAEN
jgi:hypothetical protein